MDKLYTILLGDDDKSYGLFLYREDTENCGESIDCKSRVIEIDAEDFMRDAIKNYLSERGE